VDRLGSVASDAHEPNVALKQLGKLGKKVHWVDMACLHVSMKNPSSLRLFFNPREQDDDTSEHLPSAILVLRMLVLVP
jgi:hypothetical protein